MSLLAATALLSHIKLVISQNLQVTFHGAAFQPFYLY